MKRFLSAAVMLTVIFAGTAWTQTAGIVTSFAPLTDNVRYQRTSNPVLPQNVTAVVDGASVQVPVTWSADGYNGLGTGTGFFVFFASVDTVRARLIAPLLQGVDPPKITVMLLPLIMPMMAGTGTSSTPLQIVNAAQLAEIAEMVNAGMLETFITGNADTQVHFRVMRDIDISGYGQDAWFNGGKGWVPIGSTSARPFRSVFDGDNKVITGLFIDDNALGANAGLFGTVSGTVRNVKLLDPRVNGNDREAVIGNVAGNIAAGGAVTGCEIIITPKAVTSITIKTQPANLSYTHGNTLNLSGLEVTLSYDDLSTADVALANFGDSISAAPANGAALSHTAHNGTSVTLRYKSTSFTVNTNSLTVEKADPSYTPPAGLTAVYGQTLANVSLSAFTGWSWMNSAASVGAVGAQTHQAAFTPADAANFNIVTDINLSVNVSPATPTVATPPTASNVIIGDALSTSTLSGGIVNGITGEDDIGGDWAWVNPTTTVSASGSFAAVFTPSSGNYNTVTADVNVTMTIPPVTLNNGSVTTPHDDLTAALTAIGAQTGDFTITIRENQTMTAGHVINTASQNITIVGETAQTITHDINNAATHLFEITASASLTLGANISIIGRSTTGEGAIVQVSSNNGTLNMSGATISGHNMSSALRGAVDISGGRLNMTGGSIRGAGGADLVIGAGTTNANVSGGADIGVVRLMANELAFARINIPSAFTGAGKIDLLELRGNSDNMTEVISYFIDKQVITGAAIASGLANIGVINFVNSAGTAQEISLTHYIDNTGTLLAFGSASAPFIITTAADLEAVGRGTYAAKNQNWSASAHYRMEENVTLAGTWTPVDYFDGNFDGNGHTISGLTGAQGLFAFVGMEGEVRNLGLVDVNIDGANVVGAIAGNNEGTISNCFVDAVTIGKGIIIGGDVVGGIAGSNMGSIVNCLVKATVSGTDVVGGIVGENFGGVQRNVALMPTINKFSISGETAFGRIAGRNWDFAGNNYARYDIGGVATPALFDEKTLTGKDGEDITAANVATAQALLSGIPAAHRPDLNEFLPPALGTAENPFLITTREQLLEVGRANAAFESGAWTLSAHYRLDADITLIENWTRIGGATDAAGFSGTFDGNNRKITGLTIDQSASQQGMFATISSTGVVKNLDLLDVNIRGNSDIGALAGHNYGIIERVFVSGTVSGSSGVVGGIVGRAQGNADNPNIGIIRNVASSANVSVNSTIAGGIVGSLSILTSIPSGTLINSYSTGQIQGTNNVGGIVGSGVIATNDNRSTVQNSVALNTGILRTSGTGTGFCRIAVVNINFVNNYGRGDIPILSSAAPDIAGLNGQTITDEWDDPEWWRVTVFQNMSETSEDWLWWESRLPQTLPPFVGSAGSPIIISTQEQLREIGSGNMAMTRAAHYELGDDITLSSEEWVRVGFNTAPFTGTLNGKGHTISGLTINKPDEDYQGFFGGIGSGGRVENLGLLGVNITGGAHTGGIAGTNLNGATITNSYVTGTITGGGDFVGGIAGNNSGTASHSWFDGDVSTTAGQNTGGIAGQNTNGTVQGNFALGTVSGQDRVGGIVGNNSSAGAQTQNNVALNTSIASVTTDLGRVLFHSAGTRTNNYAFAGMTVNGTTRTSTVNNDNEGADITTDTRLAVQTILNEFPEAHRPNLDDYMPGVKMSNPILIADDDDLRRVGSGETFGGAVWGLDKFYRQTDNITLDESIPNNWTPIAPVGDNSPNAFTGGFDGGGFAIYNVNVSGGSPNRGLFGVVRGARLENIRLENARITGSESNVGGIAGRAEGATIVRRSSVSGVVRSIGANVGGIVGMNYGTVEECYAMAEVSGEQRIGGIAGASDNNAVVRNNFALNPWVETRNANSFAVGNRIVGDNRANNGAQMQGNYAAAGMIINNGVVQSNDANSADGADITSANMSGLQTTLNGYFTTNVPQLSDLPAIPTVIVREGTSTNLFYTGYADLTEAFTHIGTKTGDFTITLLAGQTMTATRNITAAGQHITIVGNGAQTIHHGIVDVGGHLFEISNTSADASLTFGNNITVQGRSAPGAGAIVRITNGTFNMGAGAEIVEHNQNTSSSIGAVNVSAGANVRFNMTGGKISGTLQNGNPGGADVYVEAASAAGRANISGEAQIGIIRMNASAATNFGSINFPYEFTGEIGRLDLRGNNNDNNMETVRSFYIGNQVITGTYAASGVANINLINFISSVGTAEPISPDYFINETGHLSAAPGTVFNPFLVTSEAELEAVGRGQNGWTVSAHYRLTRDMDLMGRENWTRIGSTTDATGFSGTFDGNGHTITGMTVNQNSANQGMFGFISTTGVVRNLGLVNVSITGTGSAATNVGAVAGTNAGLIERVFVSGTVSGHGSVGGIAGRLSGTSGNTEIGIIRNAYSTADVSGITGTIGGIVGTLPAFARVQNTYSTGRIQGAERVGGIVGEGAGSGIIQNNVALNSGIWRISGELTSIGRIDGGLLLPTRANNYARSDLVLPVAVTPDANNGQTITNEWQNNPTWWRVTVFQNMSETSEDWLWWQDKLPSSLPPIVGSADDPIIITTEAQLRMVGSGNMGMSLSAHYRMDDDVTLLEIWTTIGGDFTGNFNGNNHVISGLTGTNGLFGRIGAGGVVRNLGLIEVAIAGTAWGTGSIAGINNGTIQNSFVKGNVSGGDNTGGIAGVNGANGDGASGNVGIMNNVLFAGTVSGGDHTGGIAGDHGHDNGSLPEPERSSMSNSIVLATSIQGNNINNNNSRITGRNHAGTLTNNYAFSGMLVNGNIITNGTLTNKDGADITVDNRTAVQTILDAFPEAHRPNLNDYLPGGKAANPILVADETDLRRVGTGAEFDGVTWGMDKFYQQTQNITLTGDWTPIGTNEPTANPFRGGFDGGNLTITNVRVGGAGGNRGLFGVARGARLENIRLVDADVRGSSANIAGIVGRAEGGTVVRRSSVSGIMAGQANVGGIAGINYGTIEDCYSTAIISGEERIGGIAGASESDNEHIQQGGAGAFVRNNFALNPSIETRRADRLTLGNRVVGDNRTGATMQGNYAFAGMIKNNELVQSTNAASADGADITLDNSLALQGTLIQIFSTNAPILTNYLAIPTVIIKEGTAYPFIFTGHADLTAAMASITTAGTYEITLLGNQTFTNRQFNVTNATVTLIGAGEERIIQYEGTTSMFGIGANGAGITLGNNITIRGIATGSTANLVSLTNGTFTMLAGSKITGHSTTNNAGVVNISAGTFIMEGGEITGNNSTNTSAALSGGVIVGTNPNAHFIMRGGSISGNTHGADAATIPLDVYVNADNGTAGRITLSGTAQIGNLRLNAGIQNFGSIIVTPATVTIEENFQGNVSALHLRAGETNASVVAERWLDRQVLTAAAGYSLTAQDVAKFTLGNFVSTTGAAPISETHHIGNSGDGMGLLLATSPTGTAFTINTPADLQAVGRGMHPTRTGENWSLSAHYELGGDIDISHISNWDPIGKETGPERPDDFPFTGRFNGKGFVIRGLRTTGNTNSRGFFGAIFSGAIVENVGLVDVNMTTGENSGILTALSVPTTTIRNSFVSGTINGSGVNIGGIVGYHGGIIENSFATAHVRSNNARIGGIAGTAHHGTIRNSIALSDSIRGNGNVQRIVGDNRDNTSTLQNNYAFAGTLVDGTVRTGTLTNAHGENITEGNVATAQALLSGMSIFAPEHIPDLMDYLPDAQQQMALIPFDFMSAPAPWTTCGAEYDPCVITTAEELAGLAVFTNDGNDTRDKKYVLGNDIDLSKYYTAWTPIGTLANPFEGNFNGADFTINALNINNNTLNNAGLFGVIDGGTVENVGITGTVAITGGENVGAVAGTVTGGGIIDKVYSTVSISGTNNVGGLVGNLVNSSITNSAALGRYTQSSGGSAGRVLGVFGVLCVLENNRAFARMLDAPNGVTTTWQHKTKDGKDGEDINSFEEFFADGGGPIYLKKRNMAFVNIESGAERDYDGSLITHTAAWGAGASAEQLVKDVDYTVAFTEGNGINAGSGTFVLTGIGNYSGTAAQNFVIRKKPVTVTVNSGFTKVFGESDPAVFTYTFTPELLNGDVFTGALSRTAGENVNSYTIGLGTLSAGANYEITVVPADFTITRAAADKPDTSRAPSDPSQKPSGVPGISVINDNGSVSYKLDTDKNLEYSMDGGVTWVYNLDLGSLPSNVEYTVLIRTKETENFYASESQEIRFRTITVGLSVKEKDRKLPADWFTGGDDGHSGKMSDSRYGIVINKRVVTGKAEFSVTAPSKAKANIVIYDNLGNAVFRARNVKSGELISWNLTNMSGRAVGNGTYLIAALTRDKNGKTHRYSGQVYVRR